MWWHFHGREFHMQISQRVQSGDWSREFATLDNRKLLGLKFTSAWACLYSEPRVTGPFVLNYPGRYK